MPPAAAEAMEYMEDHRHPGLAAGHVISVGGFIGDLRPCLVNKATGTQIDNGTEPSHCRSCGQPAEAELGNRRRNHALSIFLQQVLIDVAVRAQAQERAVDQMHSRVPGHDLIQCLELSFVIV